MKTAIKTFSIGDLSFDYTWNRRKRRKYVSLKVEANNCVVVQLPWICSRQNIPRILKRHKDWIKDQFQKNTQRGLYRSKQWVEGEVFDFLGYSYVLKLNSQIMPRLFDLQRQSVVVQGSSWFLNIDIAWSQAETEAWLAKKIERHYRREAEHFLVQRCHHYAQMLDVQPHSIRIRALKSRWGSCSLIGDLVFNWKLMMAPVSIVNYVVIHELCHIHEHNHSPQFWSWVELIDPDYCEHKRWLKEQGHLLDLF